MRWVGSLVADGCVIEEGATIENSVIGLRCRIGRNVVIRDSVLMGNDYYQPPGEETDQAHLVPGESPGVTCPALGIGPGSQIDGAIIDKNCRIGRNVRVANTAGVDDSEETEYGMICDRIVVIPKETTLPDGWSI